MGEEVNQKRRSAWVYRLRLLAVLASIYLCVTVVSMWKRGPPMLHVLNGLDVGAEVTIDGGPPIVVPSQERRSVQIDPGKHRFRCTVAGRVVDESTETVDSGRGLVAYNVQGAAPLFVDEIKYETERERTAGLVDLARSPEAKLLAGRIFVEEPADYVFVEPPEKITTTGGDTAARRHADVAPGGWRCAVAAFRAAGNVATPADLAETVAFAEIDDDAVVAEVVKISRDLRPRERHEAFLEKLKAARSEAGGRPR